MSRDITNHIYITGTDADVAYFERRWCADDGPMGSCVVQVERGPAEDRGICDTSICAEYSSCSSTGDIIDDDLQRASRECPEVTVRHDWVVWSADGEHVVNDGGQEYNPWDQNLAIDDD